MKQFVVVSGLPASGKSSLGRSLGKALRLPVIDKDIILEALFESLGVGDRDWRTKLSRASDEILWKLAGASNGSVLVNWWHHDSAPSRIMGLNGQVIQVFCDCPREVAEKRFRDRIRHPGFLDEERLATSEIATQLPYKGALELDAELLIVDTTKPVKIEPIIQRIRESLEFVG